LAGAVVSAFPEKSGGIRKEIIAFENQFQEFKTSGFLAIWSTSWIELTPHQNSTQLTK
jgi:hypothetical protein